MLMRRAVFIAIIGAIGVAAVPAVAQNRGGFFGVVPNLLGGGHGNSRGGGEDYANTPEVPYKGGCRVVNQPLYDDDDHVVAHKRVKECPATPILANCRPTNKPVYDDHDKVVAHQRIQECPAQ
jgi:hypothetical protein